MIKRGIEIGVAIAPVLTYLPLFVSKNIQHTVEHFDIKISFIVITSSILKICFFIGESYNYALLIQSILLLITMIALLFVISRHSDKVNFLNIILIFALFACVSVSISYYLRDENVYVQTVGSIALFIDVLITIPQIWHNFQAKNAEGIPLITISAWSLGDVVKTMCYLILNAPLQFICCAICQFISDIIVIIQIFIYSPKMITEGISLEDIRNFFPKRSENGVAADTPFEDVEN